MASAAVQVVETHGLRLKDYVIERIAGKGKFSVVLKAARDSHVCALKKVSKECMETEASRKRVEEEIKLLQSLDHPNIVKHCGMFMEDDGILYIELEWADGGDLKQLLQRHSESSAHLSEARIWNFFVQIARGKFRPNKPSQQVLTPHRSPTHAHQVCDAQRSKACQHPLDEEPHLEGRRPRLGEKD